MADQASTAAQPAKTDMSVNGADNGSLKIAVVPAPVTDDSERRTRSGKFTLRQLRQTDGLVPLQSGTNQFDSQKGKTSFGMPRNTATPVSMGPAGRWQIEANANKDNIVRLQSGTNQFDSQKGMTSFGATRDVKGKHLKRIWELEFPEEAVTDMPVNQQKQQ